MECQQIIGISCTIRHLDRGQGKLDVIFCPQHHCSWSGDVHKGRVVDCQLNAHKLQSFLRQLARTPLMTGKRTEGSAALVVLFIILPLTLWKLNIVSLEKSNQLS